MDPIPYTDALESARSRAREVLAAMPRTKIVTEEADYLAAEVRSALFRFVDDVELAFDDDAKVIHFRSASRIGYSDLGVNRKRMQRIREALS